MLIKNDLDSALHEKKQDITNHYEQMMKFVGYKKC